jgi:hypothetical protein
MIRVVLLALSVGGCVVQPTATCEWRPPAPEVMQPCAEPIKPAVAPARQPDMDVFSWLRSLSRWASDVQLAREDTAAKLAECAGRLTRAQDWIRQRDRQIP